VKKLLRYGNGDEYIMGDIASIEPNGIAPVEEYDLDGLTREEFRKFKENRKDKKLRAKMKRING